MTAAEQFTPDFVEQPYWWDRAPLQGAAAPAEVPRQVDAAIVGGGFTGMMAALTLARAGRAVAVLDAQDMGYGAARRNAGFLGRTLKRSVGWLTRHHGAAYALAVYRELDEALRLVRDTAAQEGIDCHATRCGRFIGATSPAHYEVLAREAEESHAALDFPFEMIARAQQHREIASDVYFGGAVIPDLGSIHPGLYHDGLLRQARAAGAQMLPATPVLAIAPDATSGRHLVRTARGDIAARDVLVATNGYTPGALDWFARRLIPFPGYIVATEILSRGKIDALLPQRRTYLDTNMNINFIRPAPDAERILFGGLTGSKVASPRAIAADLIGILQRLLPGIGEVRLYRAWTGFCAATFDFLPHIGSQDGIHYALGYNYAGVPMGTLLGRKLALRVLGSPEAKSAFESHRFPALPLYRGNGWFVPLAMKYFDWKDARLARRRPAATA